jgi:hypothetical protein
MRAYNVLICSKPHLKPRNRTYTDGHVVQTETCTLLDDAGRELASIGAPNVDFSACEDYTGFDG